MVLQNKALICDKYQIYSKYASNMHANKQLVNSENWSGCKRLDRCNFGLDKNYKTTLQTKLLSSYFL